MTFQAEIVIPRYTKAGKALKPESVASRKPERFVAPIGMPHIAVLQGLGYAMQCFLHQDAETAQHQVALLNGTLRRLEFYLDEDAEGHLVLKTREPEGISPLDTSGKVR